MRIPDYTVSPIHVVTNW